MAEIQRGAPSIAPGSQQLPFGGASQVNADTPSFADIPVQFAPPDNTPDTPDAALSDNAQILVAPPHPDYRAVRSSGAHVPNYVVRHLPRLMAASKDSDAPLTLKALYRNIVAQLDNEQAR